jgi:glycosyltransferase involved in cell wall biosynthesis
MRILMTLGDAYLPQRFGGAQSSTRQLVDEMEARGHEVAVMCRLVGGGRTEWRSRVARRLSGRRFSRDTGPGHPVFRAWDPTDAGEVVRSFAPDVALVQNGATMPIARSLQAHGVPVAIYFRNVEFGELGAADVTLESAFYIANSRFTARRFGERFGIDCAVVPPIVRSEAYRTRTTGENVTFINPYPVKGLDIALAIAERCPDIPFAFVESWGIDDGLRRHLDAHLDRLPNVRLVPRTSDMRSVFGRARLLLAPSRWEEAWGRVATEAHCSGIPVIGSRQGGLPEAIGEGGLTLDVDAPIDDWVAAVRRLWDDDCEHSRLSDAALRFAERPDIQPGHQIATLLEILDSARAARAAPKEAR